MEPSPIAETGYSFLYQNLVALSRSARVLGNEAEAADFAKQAEAAKAQFNAEFLIAANGTYWKGTQCSQALPLYLGLAPSPTVQSAALKVLADNIAKRGNHLTVGMFGVKWMLLALAALGRNDLAHAVSTQRDYPVCTLVFSFANVLTLNRSAGIRLHAVAQREHHLGELGLLRQHLQPQSPDVWFRD